MSLNIRLLKPMTTIEVQGIIDWGQIQVKYVVNWLTATKMKFSTFDTLFYGISLTLTFALKLFYSTCETQQLLFILSPVTWLVELFTGRDFSYRSGLGYLNIDNAIVIGKGCAGMNYLIIVLCMLSFTVIKAYSGIKNKAAAFIILSVASYLLTIFVNAFRIISSMLVLDLKIFDNLISRDILHKSVGIFSYFFFLLVIYSVTLKIIGKASVEKAKTS